METLWDAFVEQHNGTTKKSQTEARKAIGELKKLVTDYRKASVEEGKVINWGLRPPSLRLKGTK
jgi:hypothetical protein